MNKKIAFIGGGSTMWVPTLFRDVAETDYLEGCEFLLHDIVPEKAKRMKNVCEVIKAKLNRDITVSIEHEFDRAIENADAIIICISTGGFDTMEVDVELPKKYGIYHSVGDTAGPGGISRTMRNVPVVTEMARKIETIAPNAWVINLSNPMDQITQAMAEAANIKIVGSCHEYMGRAKDFQDIFGLDDWYKDITCVVGGLNHFAFILDMRIKGEDGYAMLNDYIAHPEGYEENIKNRKEMNGAINPAQEVKDYRKSVAYDLYDVYGYFPYPGPRHIVEFFPYFLSEKTNYGKDVNVALTTVEDRRTTWTENQMKRIDEWTADDYVFLKNESGITPFEAMPRVIAALFGGEPVTEPLVMPNVGQIANLPVGPCVETMVHVREDSVSPLAVGNLPQSVLPLIHRHAVIQDLTVKGAMEGDKKKIMQALLADPMMNTNDFRDAEKLLDEMMEGNKAWLPQFYK